MMNSKKNLLILFEVIIISILVLAVLYLARTYFFEETRPNEQNFTPEESAMSQSKQLNYLDAAAEYSVLAEKADSVQDSYYFKIKELAALIASGNYSPSVSEVLELYNNTEVQPQYRAQALIVALSAYGFSKNDDVLADILGKESDTLTHEDSQIALIGLMNEVYDLYPMSYIDYRVASRYLEIAFLSESAVLKQDYIQLAKFHLERSESLAITESEGVVPYWLNPDPVDISKEYWFSGQLTYFASKVMLARLENLENSEIDDLYQNHLSYFEGEHSPNHWSKHYYYRLYYASYLANQYGETQSEQIQELLNPLTRNYYPFSLVNDAVIWPQLQNTLSNDDGALVVLINELATYSKEFSELLNLLKK